MDTIKWLLQKAYENDYSILISKSKNVISLKVSKKTTSGKKLDETIEITQELLNRIEVSSAGSLVKSAFDKISEEEKFHK